MRKLLHFLMIVVFLCPSPMRAYALAPEFKRKTMEELEKIAQEMERLAQGKTKDKQELLLSQRDTAEVIAEGIAMPFPLRDEEAFKRLRERIREGGSSKRGINGILWLLERVSHLPFPEIWDPEAKLLEMSTHDLMLFLLRTAHSSGRTQTRQYRISPGASVRELRDFALLDNDPNDPLPVMVAKPSRLSAQHMQSALGHLVNLGKEKYSLGYAAEILERAEWVSPRLWKLILAADHVQRHAEAFNEDQKAFARRLRVNLYQLLRRAHAVMRETTAGDDPLADWRMADAATLFLRNMDWDTGVMAGKARWMIADEVVSRVEAQPPGEAIRRDEQDAVSAGTSAVMVLPASVPHTDVHSLLDQQLLDRVLALTRENRHEDAALLLFIAAKEPEDFQRIKRFLQQPVFVLNAALLLHHLAPAAGAHFLARATRAQQRAWFGYGQTAPDEDTVDWVIELLKMLDQHVHTGTGLATPSGEILWRMLAHPGIPEGEQLIGRVFQKALEDRGRHFDEWALGHSLYLQISAKLAGFEGLLHSEEDVVRGGQLLKSRFPKSLEVRDPLNMAEDDWIAGRLIEYLNKEDYRQAADILFLKLSPIRAYRVVRRIAADPAYPKDIDEVMPRILAATQPWIAARFLSETYNASGFWGKTTAYDWVVDQFHAVHAAYPAQNGSMSWAAQILREMMEQPAEKGGNVPLVISLLDPAQNSRHILTLQGLYEEIQEKDKRILDWHTFVMTGKFLAGDLGEADARRMATYWEGRMVLIGGNAVTAVEAAKALQRLGLPYCIDPLFRQWELLHAASAADFGVSQAQYEEFQEAIARGLLALGPEEVAVQLALRVKASDEFALAVMTPAGVKPIEFKERPKAWRIGSDLFGRFSRSERLSFVLAWVHKSGDSPEILKMSLSMLDAAGHAAREPEWFIPVEFSRGSWKSDMETKDVLLRAKVYLDSCGALAGKELRDEAFRQTFISLYLEPALESEARLSNEALEMFLNMLYLMELYDIALPQEHQKSLVRLLQRNRKTAVNALADYVRPQRFMGPAPRSTGDMCHAILDHNRKHPIGDIPQYGLRAQWAYGAMNEGELQESTMVLWNQARRTSGDGQADLLAVDNAHEERKVYGLRGLFEWHEMLFALLGKGELIAQTKQNKDFFEVWEMLNDKPEMFHAAMVFARKLISRGISPDAFMRRMLPHIVSPETGIAHDTDALQMVLKSAENVLARPWGFSEAQDFKMKAIHSAVLASRNHTDFPVMLTFIEKQCKEMSGMLTAQDIMNKLPWLSLAKASGRNPEAFKQMILGLEEGLKKLTSTESRSTYLIAMEILLNHVERPEEIVRGAALLAAMGDNNLVYVIPLMAEHKLSAEAFLGHLQAMQGKKFVITMTHNKSSGGSLDAIQQEVLAELFPEPYLRKVVENLITNVFKAYNAELVHGHPDPRLKFSRATRKVERIVGFDPSYYNLYPIYFIEGDDYSKFTGDFGYAVVRLPFLDFDTPEEWKKYFVAHLRLLIRKYEDYMKQPDELYAAFGGDAHRDRLLAAMQFAGDVANARKENETLEDYVYPAMVLSAKVTMDSENAESLRSLLVAWKKWFLLFLSREASPNATLSWSAIGKCEDMLAKAFTAKPDWLAAVVHAATRLAERGADATSLFMKSPDLAQRAHDLEEFKAYLAAMNGSPTEYWRDFYEFGVSEALALSRSPQEFHANILCLDHLVVQLKSIVPSGEYTSLNTNGMMVSILSHFKLGRFVQTGEAYRAFISIMDTYLQINSNLSNLHTGIYNIDVMLSIAERSRSLGEFERSLDVAARIVCGKRIGAAERLFVAQLSNTTVAVDPDIFHATLKEFSEMECVVDHTESLRIEPSNGYYVVNPILDKFFANPRKVWRNIDRLRDMVLWEGGQEIVADAFHEGTDEGFILCAESVNLRECRIMVWRKLSVVGRSSDQIADNAGQLESAL